MDRTYLVGRSRSPALKELDTAIGAYEKNNGLGLAAVIARFEAWKRENGGEPRWRSSPRNQGKPIGAFTELEIQLTFGDQDVAAGLTPTLAAHHRHARLGVLYLYSKMSVSTNVFGMLFDTASSFASGAFNFNLSSTSLLDPKIAPLSGVAKFGAQAGQQLLGAMEKRTEIAVGNAASGLVLGTEDPKAKSIVLTKTDSKTEQTIWEWLKAFVQDLLDALYEKFLSLQTYASVITAALKAIVTEISSQAGSFFTDAVTTLSGLDKVVKGFSARIVAAIRMSGVRLVQGYPAAVVDAIHRSMTMSGIEGLVQTARGAGGLAMNALVPGLGQLASLLLSACDKLFRIIWRLGEISEMKEVFATARTEFDLGKAYEKALLEGRDATPPLHARPADFARWFRKYATSVPALACLTLTTGICGDKMTYLAMYNDDGGVITDKNFIEQADVIDSLKAWGSDYLSTSGYEFHTSDSFVAALLKRSAQNAENLRLNAQNTVQKVYDRTLTALGGQTRAAVGYRGNPNYEDAPKK
jgi:hypothetical protein